MKKQILSGILSLGIVASMLPAAFAEDTAPASFDYNYDFNSKALPDDCKWHEVGKKPADAAAVGTWLAKDTDDNAIGWVAAPYRRPAAGTNNQNSYGLAFLTEYCKNNAVNDTSFVVSAEFMTVRDKMFAYVIAPRFTDMPYAFPLAIKLDTNGVLSCGNQKIAEIKTNEWNRVSVRYTLSSANGLSADVYYNGALKAAGLHDSSAKTNMMYINSLCDADTAYSQKLSGYGLNYAYDRKEIFYLDNVYIGEDESKLAFDPAISAVQESREKNQLTVEFNQPIENITLATVSNIAGTSAATVTNISWQDQTTAVLSLDQALELGTDYDVSVLADGIDGVMTKRFTTDFSYFWDFDHYPATSDRKYFTDRNKGVSIGRTAGRLTDQNASDYALGIAGAAGTYRSPTVGKHQKGFFVLDEQMSRLKSGKLHINLDFKIDNPDVYAYIISFRNAYDDAGYRVVLDADKNVTLFGDADKQLGTVEVGKWSNLDIIYQAFGSNYYIVTSMDGGEPIEWYGSTPNRIAFDVGANTSDENFAISPRGDGRNEFLFIDNMYIGTDTDYAGSAFETALNAGATSTAKINSGAYANAGSAILALYSGTTLKEVKVVDFDLVRTESKNITAKFSSYQAGDTVKLMAWNSLDGLVPMTEAK